MSRIAASADASRTVRRRCATASSGPFAALCALLAGCAGPPGPMADAPDAAAADASRSAPGPVRPPPSSLLAETRDWLGDDAPSPPTRPPARRVPVDPAAHRVDVDAVRVPLASLLFLLARDAALELVSHAPLDAEITYRAADRPLADVLHGLAAQAGFHWRIDGGRLVVRGPGPWSDTYAVDYLNIERSVRSSVGLATRVGTMSAPAGLDTGGRQQLRDARRERRRAPLLGLARERPGRAGRRARRPRCE